jgi:hypothetical protein
MRLVTIIALLLAAPLSAQTMVNVTKYGAVCDGVIDNTPAFTKAAQAALSGNGEVYIPACNSTYAVNLSAFSNTNRQVWLDIDDENDLTILGGSINGQNIRITGKGNQHEGISGRFVTRPHVNWMAAAKVSALDMNGVEQAVIEGIAFFSQYSNRVPVANLHTNTTTGAGTVYVTLKGDEFISGTGQPALFVGDDPAHKNSIAGFGLYLEGDSFDSNGLCISLESYGGVEFSGPVPSFCGGGNIVINNATTGYYFHNILSEDLRNETLIKFYPGPSTAGQVTIDNVEIADPIGTTYLFGAYSRQNGNVAGLVFSNITNAGNGLYDPASTANFFGAIAISAPCAGLNAASRLYGFEDFTCLDPQMGHSGFSDPAYIGNSSSNNPALVIDSPRYPVGLTVKQGIGIGAYPVANLPSAASAGPNVIAIAIEPDGRRMIAISDGASWSFH